MHHVLKTCLPSVHALMPCHVCSICMLRHTRHLTKTWHMSPRLLCYANLAWLKNRHACRHYQRTSQCNHRKYTFTRVARQVLNSMRMPLPLSLPVQVYTQAVQTLHLHSLTASLHTSAFSKRYCHHQPMAVAAACMKGVTVMYRCVWSGNREYS